MTEYAPRYFSSNHAHHLIAQTLVGAGMVRIATAYFEASGWQVLQDVLAGKSVRLLIGREEGGADREFNLDPGTIISPSAERIAFSRHVGVECVEGRLHARAAGIDSAARAQAQG